MNEQRGYVTAVKSIRLTLPTMCPYWLRNLTLARNLLSLTGKQNYSYVYNKYLSQSFFVSNIKNLNCNPFKSYSSLSISAFFCICCVIYKVLKFFERLFPSMFPLIWQQVSLFGFDKFRDTTPLIRQTNNTYLSIFSSNQYSSLSQCYRSDRGSIFQQNGRGWTRTKACTSHLVVL